MNKIITRDWINDDIVIRCGVTYKMPRKVLIESYTKQDLCQFINFWKVELLSNGAKRGDKIGYCIEPSDIHSTALMFAAFELGMSVVVLHRPNNERECLAPKSNSHLPLDFFVYLAAYEHIPLLVTAIVHFSRNSKKVLVYGNHDWQNQRSTLKSDEETPILAQPGDVALLCNSSGTTGVPKLISHSHEFFHDLCTYNWEVLKYDPEDHFMHLSSLNHGAALSFVLPALHICKHNYFYVDMGGKGELQSDPFYQEYYDLTNDCIEHGITRIFCAGGGAINEFIKHLRARDIKLPNTNIMILSFISPDWRAAISESVLQSINSPFGCSEVCGPVFMTWLDKDTVDKFDPRYLGYPTEGFYDTKVIDGRIHTSTPYNQVVFDDIVEERADGYYFKSKNRLQKLNDIDINPVDIMEILEHYNTRYAFEIYIDEVYNELYILTSDSKTYKMGKFIVEDIDSFYHGKIPTANVIYDPELNQATISNKADKDKLAGIVERYRLTKNS